MQASDQDVCVGTNNTTEDARSNIDMTARSCREMGQQV